MILKFLCKHKWTILKEISVKNHLDEVYRIILLLTCENCGKIKKINLE